MLWGIVLDNGLKIRKSGNGKIYSLTCHCKPGTMLRFRTKGNFAYPDPNWNGLVCSLIGDFAGFLLIDKWPTPILFVGAAQIGDLVKCTVHYSANGPQALLLRQTEPEPEPPKISSDPWSWQRIVPLTTFAIKI